MFTRKESALTILIALMVPVMRCASSATQIIETHTYSTVEQYDLTGAIGQEHAIPCIYDEHAKCRAYFFPLEIHQPFPWTVYINLAPEDRILTVIVGSGGYGLLVRENRAGCGMLSQKAHVTRGPDSVEAYSSTLHFRAEGINKGSPLTLWFHHGQKPCADIKLCTCSIGMPSPHINGGRTRRDELLNTGAPCGLNDVADHAGVIENLLRVPLTVT